MLWVLCSGGVAWGWPPKFSWEWVAGCHAGAPLWVRVLVDNPDPEVTGRLQISAAGAVCQTRELQLLTGETEFDWVFAADSMEPHRMVQAAWVTARGVTPLPDLRLRPESSLQLSVLRCMESVDLGSEMALLENWRKKQREVHRILGLGTAPLAMLPVDPPQFPPSPVTLSCFDYVFLGSRAFCRLDADQCRALGEWIEGGGTACIVVNTLLGAFHAELLDRLASHDVNGEPLFERDSGGIRQWGPRWNVSGVIALEAGTGFALVVSEDSPALVNGKAECDSAVEALRSRGQVAPPGAPPVFSRALRGTGVELAAALVSGELPEVPIFELMVLGLLLLVLVGPVERALLRHWGRPHYTWWLCPLTAVLFAAAMFVASNQRLDEQLQMRSLHVVDIAPEGRGFRQNDFSMQLTRSAGFVSRQHRGGLCAVSSVAGTGGSSPNQFYGDLRRQSELRCHQLGRSAVIWRSVQFGESVDSVAVWPREDRESLPWDRLRALYREGEKDPDAWTSLLNQSNGAMPAEGAPSLHAQIHVGLRYSNGTVRVPTLPRWIRTITEGMDANRSGPSAARGATLLCWRRPPWNSNRRAIADESVRLQSVLLCWVFNVGNDIYLYRCVLD